MDDKERFDDTELQETVSEEETEVEEKQNKDENDYEDICYICRRPESRAGKMIKCGACRAWNYFY